jgi:hypothetical protein
MLFPQPARTSGKWFATPLTAVDKGTDVTSPPTPTPKEERDRRYDEQMSENARVISESARTLETVTERLEKALERLITTGDVPFSDLERRRGE